MKLIEYQFAIKKIEKRDGTVVNIPIARLKTKIKFLNLNPWLRIIKIYKEYELTSSYLDRDFGLTNLDCIKHIEAFKRQNEKNFVRETETIEMIFEDQIEGMLQAV